MIRTTAILAITIAFAMPAFAAAPPSSSSARGKVSLQDLHFSSKAEAVAVCDKAPVTTAADGSFMCSVPADSAAAKGSKTGYDLKEAKKP